MIELGSRLHFIGIGGIGVSAVARIAIGRGYQVSGSDVRQSQLTDSMHALGARVTIGHAPENLEEVDVVVVSTAIPAHNVELVAARERGLHLIHRSDLLAFFLSHGTTVGVTGTHGKGTVSAMLVSILDAADRDPGFIIGGILNNYGINARSGGGELLIAEIDDSDGTHRNVSTTYLVCNFLEADHLNFYKDLDHIIESMAEAVSGNPRLERVFMNGDCEGNRKLLKMIDTPAITYGVEKSADFRGTLISETQLPIHFRATAHDVDLGEFTLRLPGLYNVVNAMGAIAVAHELGVEVEAMHQGLAEFRGLENRFTIVDAKGVSIVKDYNSHPTAMRKVLQSARPLATGRVFTVFKPYRYTLTNYLKDEYATAFAGSDEVIITTMYAANEDPIPGIDTQFVVDMLRDNGHKVTLIPDQTQIVSHLEGNVANGDQVIFFGGDDFFRMADAWAKNRTAQ